MRVRRGTPAVGWNAGNYEGCSEQGACMLARRTGAYAAVAGRCVGRATLSGGVLVFPSVAAKGVHLCSGSGKLREEHDAFA